MSTPIATLLRSKIVWRVSGITYPTAVVATRGRYTSPEGYIQTSKHQMEGLMPLLPASRVLEFGCGLGGNLLAIAQNIQVGYGLDVNSGYLRIARRLARRFRIENVHFSRYDGTAIPEFGLLDLVICVGVFERLPPAAVAGYIRQLMLQTAPSGRLAMCFLMDRARGTPFSKRLGDAAYHFWTRDEIESLASSLGLRIEAIFGFSEAADLYVLRH